MSRQTDNQRRWVFGLGAAAGGMLVAAIGQCAVAPSAHADDPISDILTDIQTSLNVGAEDLAGGANYFAADNIPAGLSDDLAGVESLLLGPGYDIFDDGTDALTGSGSVTDPFYVPPVTVPTDLADATSLAQSYLESGETLLTTAATDFGAGDYAGWAVDSVLASEAFVSAPDETIIGLTESLLGGI
jgi:hypothetical protein